MPRHITDLTSVAIFFILGAGFVLLTYLLVAMLAPRREAVEKIEPYECGEVITGHPWVNIHIRYYIFAMLFLIFDIETVFLFPWAVIYRKLGLFGLVEMLIFIIILVLGLVYPWKKGALKWEYSTRD